MAGLSKDGCVSIEKKIQQLQNFVEDLELNGVEYAAGDAIDPVALASLTISVLFDNSTITLNGDGKLQASAASDLTEGPGIDITAGVISAQVDGTTVFLVGSNIASWSPGNGLETSSTTLSVKAHTYIDVTSDGVAVDFTEISGYSGSAKQYLQNDNGTIKWVTVSTC